MHEPWRQVLQKSGLPPAPESEPLAGDIDLLVPIEPGWRALDLSGGYGARAAVLAHRCREVVAVTRDARVLPVLEARAEAHHAGLEALRSAPLDATSVRYLAMAGRITALLAGTVPPTDAPFDLVVVEGEAPWTLERLRSLQPAGGWLVWLTEGQQPPRPSGGVRSAARIATEVLDWGRERILAPQRWEVRLAAAGYALDRTWIHAREYIWGYLPFDAYRAQRYYLESLQEEAQGAARGKARVARALGQAGIYPYLVSAYAIVARAAGGPP